MLISIPTVQRFFNCKHISLAVILLCQLIFSVKIKIKKFKNYKKNNVLDKMKEGERRDESDEKKKKKKKKKK